MAERIDDTFVRDDPIGDRKICVLRESVRHFASSCFACLNCSDISSKFKQQQTVERDRTAAVHQKTARQSPMAGYSMPDLFQK
jgi:hypothetical protein